MHISYGSPAKASSFMVYCNTKCTHRVTQFDLGSCWTLSDNCIGGRGSPESPLNINIGQDLDPSCCRSYIKSRLHRRERT